MCSFSEHSWLRARRCLATSTFLPQPMPRHLTSMLGHRTLDIGHWTLDIGQGTLDIGQGTGDRGQGTGDRGQRPPEARNRGGVKPFQRREVLPMNGARGTVVAAPPGVPAVPEASGFHSRKAFCLPREAKGLVHPSPGQGRLGPSSSIHNQKSSIINHQSSISSSSLRPLPLPSKIASGYAS